MFSDILITSDFDHTLSARDSSIPRRNLEAIEYFVANGGAFTVNTGRSLPMCRYFLDRVPVNAPVIAYNGGAAYDFQEGKLVFCHEIELDPAAVVRRMEALFPELVTEVEGLHAHYLFKENPMWEDFCRNNCCDGRYAQPEDDLGPFLKFCAYGPLRDNTVADLYRGTEEELALYDRVEAIIRREFGADTAVYRAAARIVDVHPKGVTKLTGARHLQALLGRKTLVCIGDGENDAPMLQGADYAFCPADGRVADRFPNVCPCGEGAVADVIFEKLPQILGKRA